METAVWIIAVCCVASVLLGLTLLAVFARQTKALLDRLVNVALRIEEKSNQLSSRAEDVLAASAEAAAKADQTMTNLRETSETVRRQVKNYGALAEALENRLEGPLVGLLGGLAGLEKGLAVLSGLKTRKGAK